MRHRDASPIITSAYLAFRIIYVARSLSELRDFLSRAGLVLFHLYQQIPVFSFFALARSSLCLAEIVTQYCSSPVEFSQRDARANYADSLVQFMLNPVYFNCANPRNWMETGELFDRDTARVWCGFEISSVWWNKRDRPSGIHKLTKSREPSGFGCDRLLIMKRNSPVWFISSTNFHQRFIVFYLLRRQTIK